MVRERVDPIMVESMLFSSPSSPLEPVASLFFLRESFTDWDDLLLSTDSEECAKDVSLRSASACCFTCCARSEGRERKKSVKEERDRQRREDSETLAGMVREVEMGGREGRRDGAGDCNWNLWRSCNVSITAGGITNCTNISPAFICAYAKINETACAFSSREGTKGVVRKDGKESEEEEEEGKLLGKAATEE